MQPKVLSCDNFCLSISETKCFPHRQSTTSSNQDSTPTQKGDLQDVRQKDNEESIAHYSCTAYISRRDKQVGVTKHSIDQKTNNHFQQVMLLVAFKNIPQLSPYSQDEHGLCLLELSDITATLLQNHILSLHAQCIEEL